MTMTSGVSDSAWGMGPGTRIVARPGTILEPPPDEASRMGVGTVDPADLELLRSLGYVGGPAAGSP